MIIAYQTNRNELVGVLKVDLIEQRDGYKAILLEKLSQQYAVKLRPLKQADEEIAAIPALQPGPIRTIYSVTPHDALKLLDAAGIHWIAPNQKTLLQQSTR